jgi:hypothetical protein
MSRLRVGVMLSVFGWATVEDVRPFARHVERLGLDSVFVGDHLISDRPLLDSVVTLATAAAVTERIRLGFGVMVVPLRHPAWVAKQVASLQHLSGNRVILGLGSGGRVHGMAAGGCRGAVRRRWPPPRRSPRRSAAADRRRARSGRPGEPGHAGAGCRGASHLDRRWLRRGASPGRRAPCDLVPGDGATVRGGSGRPPAG